MAPFFSIGVTNYDRKEMLIETLNSILNQTFTDYEVTVSNDNPDRKITHESLGIFDKRIKLVNQTINLGPVGNMNFLLQQSTGRYFTWTADDDLYLPKFLESAYKTLVKYAFPKCVFTSYDHFCKERPQIKSDNISDRDELLSGREFLYRYSKGKIKAISVRGFIEEKTIKEIGGIEDVAGNGIAVFSEYLLFVRCGILDKVAYIDRPLVLFRLHDNSFSIATTDLDMYRRGADNLTRKCIEIFKGTELKNHFYTYLRFILNLSILANLGIMSRRKTLGDKSPAKIIAYLLHTRKYISTLKRTSLYLIALAALIHTELSIMFFLIGCKIKKILEKKQVF